MSTSNKNIQFRGKTLAVESPALAVGSKFPDFTVVGTDMSDVSSSLFQGKVALITTVPSVDTPVCQKEVKRFNQEASKLSDEVVVLTISMDLPFAQKRWCAGENIERVVPLSDYKYRTFGSATGTFSGEMGLLVRAVFVVGTDNVIRHVEYVPDISQEPDYDAALATARTLVS